MSANFAQYATPHEEPRLRRRPASAEPASFGRESWQADRACCCSARPAVAALLPPAPGRDHPTELLLCGHHYRASREALEAAGATVWDETGQPVTARNAALVGAR